MPKGFNIPLRPKNKRYDMSAEEMDCLAWYVISGCKKEDAYMIFVRPDLKNVPKLKKEYANQFFSSADARNFVSDYKRLLDSVEEKGNKELSDESREKRKKDAQKNIEDKTIDIMLGDLETIEELDAVVKVADRIGALAEKEVTDVKPQRYLCELCSRCVYKSFVESHVEQGDIINECDICRALSFAKEHGFVYEPDKLLEVRKDDNGNPEETE